MTTAIITAIFILVATIVVAQSSSKLNTEYSARFMPITHILSRWNRGFCLTGNRFLSLENSYKNANIFGATGSKKTAVVISTTIFNTSKHASLIINDPSSELRTLCQKTIEPYSEIRVLDYSHPERSICWNPLARIRNISDIKKISKLIVTSSLGSKGGDNFWNLSAESVIQFFIKLLLYHCAEEFHNLYNVVHLVNVFSSNNAGAIDKIVVKTKDAYLFAEYKSLISASSATLAGILATTRSALSIFSDPSIAQVTSKDEFSIEEMRAKKICLFLNNSIKDQKYYAVLTSIFFEQAFGEIMSSIPSKTVNPILCIIEEASSIMIPSIELATSNLRKHKSGVLQAYQDYNQVINLYGLPVAKALNANAFSKIYMPGVGIDVAQQLSDTIGKYEFLDSEGKKHVRPLLLPEEIRQLNQSLIVCGNLPVMKANLHPYYRQWRYRHLKQAEPMKVETEVNHASIPLLPII